jgi:hypothetical protein
VPVLGHHMINPGINERANRRSHKPQYGRHD